MQPDISLDGLDTQQSELIRPVTELHLDDLLREAHERGASDLHLSVGLPAILRIDGSLVRTDYVPFSPMDIQADMVEHGEAM